MTSHDDRNDRPPDGGRLPAEGTHQPGAPGGDPTAEEFLRELEELKERDRREARARPTPHDVAGVGVPREVARGPGRPDHVPAAGHPDGGGPGRKKSPAVGSRGVAHSPGELERRDHFNLPVRPARVNRLHGKDSAASCRTRRPRQPPRAGACGKLARLCQPCARVGRESPPAPPARRPGAVRLPAGAAPGALVAAAPRRRRITPVRITAGWYAPFRGR
jgi:hypothetical protein